MTVTTDGLAATLTDAEWAELSSRLLAVRFPTARPDQTRPAGDWSIWLVLAGRGWGKTRAGAEDVVDSAIEDPGDYFVCAPTFRDMRAVCVEGPSGLLKVLTRRAVAHEWNLTTTQIALANGSRIYCGSADEPDRWRGYNFKGGWCDEVAAWRRPDTFVQLRLATRMGGRPRIVVTTTPKPTALLKDLVARTDGTVHVTRGRTWDNADNLSEAALEELRRTYGGTRLGRQELEGELLTDTPGALVRAEWIDRVDAHPPLDRVSTGIDPAVTSGADADESGIITVGRGTPPGAEDFHVYVIADVSGRFTPEGTCRTAADSHHGTDGDVVVGEVNNGGDYIGSVMRQVDPTVPYRAVRATRGKAVRAEKMATLYEQGRVHHVGVFPELERQLCEWSPDAGWSPDRLDAEVWAIEDLTEPRKKRRGLMVRT